MSKITQQDVELARIPVANEAAGKIVDRIDYVLTEIYKTFGKTIRHWYFDGAGEGEIGELPFIDYNGTFGDSLVIEPQLYGSYALINGCEWDFTYGEFPTRWLFNDFEDELRVAVENYPGWKAEQKRQAKEKKEAQKKKKAAMMKAIKARLTPEQWKFLKLEEDYKEAE